MFKNLFLTLALAFTATTLFAQSSLTVEDPHRWDQLTQGIIDNVDIEVSPNGIYANVDMTFTINADQTLYNATDTLEAVLQFTLPENSYIYDSWLWLDNTNIIMADLIEKNRAISIYEGIVSRRRDPSLLIKTGKNSYKLNVYPMTTSYPRKIKISYSTPMSIYSNNAKVTLPTSILRASKNTPPILLSINKTAQTNTPTLITHDYNYHLVNSSSNKDKLFFYASDYKDGDIVLQYNTNLTSGVSLTTFPINNNEGYYQLSVSPSTFGVQQTGRNITIILDHYSNTNLNFYTIQEIKSYVKTSLQADYNTNIDSFNIFYVDNGKVKSTSTGWEAINRTNIDQALNNIPASYATSNISQYKQLLIDALRFSATKNSSASQAVLLSSNYFLTTDQALADSMFKEIKDSIGAYNNTINVIYYSRYGSYYKGSYYYGNDIWNTKLTLATNGVYYRYSTFTSYVYSNGKYIYTPDLNVQEALSNSAQNMGGSTNSYNISINATSGFTYSSYPITPSGKIGFHSNYNLVGKYYGNLSNNATVNINSIINGNNINTQANIPTAYSGDTNTIKAWTNKYIADLIDANNKHLAQEIIDSSINNRVLCDLTAFLAVETGDTINTNLNDNPNVVSIKKVELKDTKLKLYPNPFSEKLIIELPEGATHINIYDITGRIVFNTTINNQQSFTWNGYGNSSNELAPGTYVVVIHTKDKKYTATVIKR